MLRWHWRVVSSRSMTRKIDALTLIPVPEVDFPLYLNGKLLVADVRAALQEAGH
jgi:hypothetical protein